MTVASSERLAVMISSTALDLPEHRREAMDACLRLGMLPIMMEHLGANASDSVEVSFELVARADLYVLVVGQRYGFVPPGYTTSITELEFERAGQRGIPRLSFFMHENHPIRATDVETGPGAVRLAEFKKR